jgi:hypothetical protein
MWTTIKNNYKIILTTVGLLLVGIVSAFLFEEYYRRFVRLLFKFVNGDKIQFYGKDFHLFASNIFAIAFGLFISLTFLLLKFSASQYRIKRASLTVVIFFVTTILITAVDSFGLVIECTACNDGIRRLTFNQPTYDKYFIISLITAFTYLLTTFLLERKRNRKVND